MVLSLPRIDPVRPVTGRTPFNDPAWSFEFKYDGFRGVLYINLGKAKFVSRQQNHLTRFDALAHSIAATLSPKVESAILDGEIISKDSANRPIFANVLTRHGVQSYVAFDVLWLNGLDLRTLPLTERRDVLRRLLRKRSPHVEQSYAVSAKSGERLYRFMCTHDLEGVIAKRLHDSYTTSTKWYKIKNPKYSQAEGRRELFNARRKKAAR